MAVRTADELVGQSVALLVVWSVAVWVVVWVAQRAEPMGELWVAEKDDLMAVMRDLKLALMMAGKKVGQ